MISGALILQQDINLRKQALKIRHFIFVLICWTLVYLAFDLLYMKKTFTVSEIVNLIFEPLKPHLWFMYAIIALYIITPFAHILVRNMTESLENLFIILWTAFTGGIQLLRIVLDYFHFDTDITYSVPLVQGTYYLGYFMIGYILYNRIKSGKKINSNRLLLIYAISFLLTFLGTYFMSNHEDVYFGDLLTYRNIFTILASVSFFVLILQNVHVTIPLFQNFLRKVSPDLFGVYLIHIIPFDLLIRTITITELHAIAGVPFFSFFVFAVSLMLVYIIRHIPVLRHVF
jgi:surface polysaccharide O-acyltransferase-like enzyme